MKPRQTNASSRVEDVIGKSVNFELTIMDIARRSERRAWWVAGSSVLMSMILAGGYFFFLPLKEKVPYLVMADAYTGTSTVARLTGDFSQNSITVHEAINRSNVAHFVLARESYDVALMNLRDWTTVYTMSSPQVAAGYTTLHAKRNPASPINVYGYGRAIRVKILSIVLLGGGPDTAPKGATVRFQRSLYDKSAGVAAPLDSKIATLEFSYKSNLAMDENHRIENPLGFQVTSYRVDNDYASAPPLEIEQTTSAPVPNLEAAPQAPPDALVGGMLPASAGLAQAPQLTATPAIPALAPTSLPSVPTSTDGAASR